MSLKGSTLATRRALGVQIGVAGRKSILVLAPSLEARPAKPGGRIERWDMHWDMQGTGLAIHPSTDPRMGLIQHRRKDMLLPATPGRRRRADRQAPQRQRAMCRDLRCMSIAAPSPQLWLKCHGADNYTHMRPLRLQWLLHSWHK